MESVTTQAKKAASQLSQEGHIHHLKEDYKNVKDSIGDAAHHAAKMTGDIVDEAKAVAQEKTAEFQKTLSSYVQNKPLAALGYAVLAGFVAALLIRR